MKQIINGKTYNTETATYICEASGGGQHHTDNGYWEENLFVTSKGAYFLLCKGGAMSMYGEDRAGSFSASKLLKALTRDEAITWAERRAIDPDQLPEDLQPEEA